MLYSIQQLLTAKINDHKHWLNNQYQKLHSTARWTKPEISTNMQKINSKSSTCRGPSGWVPASTLDTPCFVVTCKCHGTAGAEHTKLTNVWTIDLSSQQNYILESIMSNLEVLRLDRYAFLSTLECLEKGTKSQNEFFQPRTIVRSWRDCIT